MKVDWNMTQNDLKKILHDAVRIDEPMSKHTTIGVGGAARVLVVPKSAAQVARLLRYLTDRDIAHVVIGKGSNLIVRDGGYDGVIIKMGTHLGKVRINQRTVFAEGGASFAALSRKMTRMKRTGLEFGIGIPGTVGGAVKMNAGAFGGEVKDVLQRIRLARPDGKQQVLKASEMEFSYRRSSLPEGSIVLSATFRCAPGKIRQDVYEKSIGRKVTQPIDARSFGSTFVNPPGGYAAQMIEGCGLKGHRKGGAMISDKHANFIINVDGSARAADVESLIRLMRTEVRRKYGVTLKTEVVVIGNR